MKLHVLIGQRKQRYEGEYGLEALACMTEYDVDANGEYLPAEERKAVDGGEFEALRVVKLEVSEKEVRAVLFPENTPIHAAVSNPPCTP